MPRIVAVCPKEFPGVSAVFKNGHALGLWEFVPFGERIPLDTAVLIVGTWWDIYMQFLTNPTVTVVPFFTSTFGQMGFSRNRVEFVQVGIVKKLMESNKIKYVLAGWEELIKYAFMKYEKEDRAFWCPYPLSIQANKVSIAWLDKIENSIGLFTPNAERKNLDNQILAAFNSGELHTNVPVVLSGERVKIYDWLPSDSYRKVISRLKITLHCGFTESFCYAAAESIAAGTVPIVSLQIARNLGIPECLPIVVHQLDSVSEIKEKISLTLSWKEEEYSERLAFLSSKLAEKAEWNRTVIKIILDKLL